MRIIPVVHYRNGMTVRQLKDYLEEYVPDIDEATGEPTLVWLQSGKGLTSPAIFITPIDRDSIAIYYEN